MSKNVRAQIRMTDEELENLKQQADDNGFTLSDYIRYLVEQDKGGEE